MASIPKTIPDYLVENIKILLRESRNGLQISKMLTIYFAKYSCFVYPDKFGFKTWGEMLGHEDLAPYCEIISNGQWVRLRTTNTTVLTPTPVIKSNSSKQAFADKSRPGTPSMDDGTASESGQESIVVAEKRARPKARLLDRGDREMSGSECSGSTVRSRGKRALTVSESESGSTSQQSSRQSDFRSSASGLTDLTHRTITPRNKEILSSERSKIIWVQREQGARYIDFNMLIMERIIQHAEPATFIDTTFCERPVLENLMQVKSMTKRSDAAKFAEFRAKHNAFEFQRGSIFQHGAAIKMANIDALMGMGLSQPKKMDGENLVRSNELLYFVDVYGSPGGYAEYFLWKRKWQAKGFGITNRFDNVDYNLAQAEHFPRESFETYYGDGGLEGKGDINRPMTISRFISFVKDGTTSNLAHVMIANGGDRPNDETDEDQKEIKCKYTFLAESVIALNVLREGGHFVCRMYDMFTPFTVGLIYLMYRCFEHVAVYKPESSLPGSSERYLLCKWRKPSSQITEIANYLSECHKVDWLSRRSRGAGRRDYAEITHLVSAERLQESYRFFDYIRRINSELGKQQFVESKDLIDHFAQQMPDHYVKRRHRQIEEKCLDLWGIPDRVREVPKYAKATTPAIRAQKLLIPYAHDFINQSDNEGEIELTMQSLSAELRKPKEFEFMAVGRQRGFYMCLGGQQVYKYHNKSGKWKQVSESLELMNNTLVYGDMVDEFEIKGAKQLIWHGFHIIDALVLGGKDIRDLPTNERYELIAKYARSMNKTSRDDLAAIRPKPKHDLKSIKTFLTSVKEHKVRARDGSLRLSYLCPVDDGVTKFYFLVSGVLFIKIFKENFGAVDFRFCLQNRLYWAWGDKVDVKVPYEFVPSPLEEQPDMQEQDEDHVIPIHGSTLLRHLCQFKF